MSSSKPMPHSGGSFIRNADGSLSKPGDVTTAEANTAPGLTEEEISADTSEPSKTAATKTTKKPVKEG